MADIFAIQKGLAEAVKAIGGVQSLPTLPGAINPPTFAVIDVDFAYHQTFGSLTELVFTCGIFMSNSDPDSGKADLVDYLNPDSTKSLLVAIESDKTLGGVCKTLIVEQAVGAFRYYTIGTNDYIGANLVVRVWA